MVIGITSNIAFFDLIYFIITILAIADNIMNQSIKERKLSGQEAFKTAA
jgi:hypothetical protein